MLVPGSKVAKDRGCRCDPDRNNYGMGVVMPHIKTPLYVKDEHCPFHGVEAEVKRYDSGRPH